MKRFATVIYLLLLGIMGAAAQFAVTSVGQITPGNCATFNSQTIIKDAGVSCVGGGTQTTIIFGGRITLQSGVCVSKTDQTAKTNVFYAPCDGGIFLPIYDGTNMSLHQFTANPTDQVGLTLALGSNWPGNTNSDLFITLVGGVAVPCSVPWANSGAGTSAQATAITQLLGVAVNATAIAAQCRTNNTTVISVAQYQGTFVGTFRTNANAGQVDLKFGNVASGGGTACICIWNVYNQQIASVSVGDSTTTWACTNVGSYAQANTCSAGPGAGNQINVIQGQTGNAIAVDVIGISANTGGNPQYVGIGIDSTSSNGANRQRATTAGASFGATDAYGDFYLAAGYHNIVRLEGTATGGSTTNIGFSGTSFTQTAISARVPY